MKKDLQLTVFFAILLFSPLILCAQEEDGCIEVSMSSGSFTATNPAGTYASRWSGTATNPQLTLSIEVNNMAKSDNDIALYYTPDNQKGEYTLSISNGFLITGYEFDFTNAITTNNMTITPKDGVGIICEGSLTAHLSVSGLSKSSTQFSVSPAIPATAAAVVSNFKVYYKENEDTTLTAWQYLYYTYDADGVPYRIPAIAKTLKGDLIAVADKRYCHSDIGYGHIDLVARISTDNGTTWGKQFTILDGNGISGDHACGYGDAAIVADCESDTLLIICCTGNRPYGSSTRSNPLRVARSYSYDGGYTWTAPEDITEEIYGIFDTRPTGKIEALFIGSGRICQSRTVKVGSHYRLYAALCTRSGNFVIYSDNFGRKWQSLGKIKNSCAPNGDEPKCEELPNGNVILSSRAYGGRLFNIFTYTNVSAGSGNWRSAATLSSGQTGGIKVGSNSTNGEIYRLKAIRNSDGDTVYVMLQSLPAANNRADVTIFYKELTTEEDYDTPIHFAQEWDGSYQVSHTGSAYSTMTLQADRRIAFFYEETPNAFCLVYVPLTLETITGGAYSILEDDYPKVPTSIKSPQATGNTANTLQTVAGKGFLTLTSLENARADVYALTGKKVSSQEIKKEESATIPLQAGIYIVNRQKVVVK